MSKVKSDTPDGNKEEAPPTKKDYTYQTSYKDANIFSRWFLIYGNALVNKVNEL